MAEKMEGTEKNDESAKKSGAIDMGVIAMIATNTMDVLGGCNVNPVLPIYLKHVGANAFQVNCIGAVYSFVGIPAAIFYAKLADRFGQKKVLLVGLSCGIACWIGLGYCASFTSMLVMRALLGLGCATGGVSTAYIMTFAPDEQVRERAIGYQTKLLYLAAAAGAGVGSVLYGIGGWLGLCCVMAGIQAVELVAGFAFWKSKEDEPHSAQEGEQGNDENKQDGSEEPAESASKGGWVIRHYINPQIGPYLLVNFFDACCGAFFNAVIVFVLIEHFNYSEPEWMHLISIYCCLTLPFSLIAEKQIEWMGGYRATVLVSNFLFIGVVVFLCNAPVNFYSPFAFLVLTFFEAAQNMSGQLLLQNQIPQDLLNEVNGLIAAQGNMVMGLAAPVAGLLYDVQWNLPFIVVAIMAVASSFFLFLAPKKKDGPYDPLLERAVSPNKLGYHRMASVVAGMLPNKVRTFEADVARLEIQTELAKYKANSGKVRGLDRGFSSTVLSSTQLSPLGGPPTMSRSRTAMP
jgi:MFS family permease